MRYFKILMPALLCLCITARIQAQGLDKIISLHYRDAQIKDILMDLEVNHGIRFYYSSGQVPVNARVNIQMKNKKVSEVLTEMFKNTGVEFVDLNGKIVLRKAPPAPQKEQKPPKTSSVAPSPISLPSTPILDDRGLSASLLPMFSEEELKSVPVISERLFDTDDADTTDYLNQKNRQTKTYMTVREQLSRTGNMLALQELRQSYIKAGAALKQKSDSLKAHTAEWWAQRSADSCNQSPFHLSVVYPLSTKGAASVNSTHVFSLNLFDGYSGAVEGVEFGGWVNRERLYVKGAQFAGIANVVQGPVSGLQSAGIINVNEGMMSGVQLGGIANINDDSANGFQAGGIANVNNGSYMGTQLGGIANINDGGMNGFQAAGIANVNAGLGNGMMCAGIANINEEQFSGLQLSGVLNVARRVRGSQIGLINVADTVTGITLGLINIIKAGYNKVEVYGAEALYINAGLRFGSHHLHTIAAIGFKPGTTAQVPVMGMGLGLGSAFPLGNKSMMNVDLMTYHLQEGTSHWTDEMNMLIQLKAAVATRIKGKLYGFAGPSVNVSVSEYSQPDTGKHGTHLMNNPLYEYTRAGNTTHPQTINVKAWAGFNAGIRF